MNRPSRHMRYRKSVYRRRNIRTVIIIAVVAVVIIFALFLLLGKLFSNKVEDDPSPKPPTPSAETATPYPFESVRHVKAALLSLDGTSSAVRTRLNRLIDAGQTAISIPLTDTNGQLLYRSQQANLGNYAIKGSSNLVLDDLAERAHADGVYLCGAYHLPAVKEENVLTRSVLMAEAAAVIAEAFLDGIDDIVIVVPALPVEQQAEILRLIESIRTLAPTAVIGLSLPEAEILEPSAARIDTLAQRVDYLALDLRAEHEGELLPFAESRMSTMLYYLLRYEMRVLIPTLADETAQGELISAVEQESVDNWMTVVP